MKYKAGDRVKIKSWEQMEKERGLTSTGNINCLEDRHVFLDIIEEDIRRDFPDRILTILMVEGGHYWMKDMACRWTDEMIECLAEEVVVEEEHNTRPVVSRFELMDFDD
jgi:hypothetical protein